MGQRIHFTSTDRRGFTAYKAKPTGPPLDATIVI